MQFATTPIGAGTALVRMSILENGNIGIGTTTPVTQFEVYGPTAGISLTRIGDEPFIRLSDAGHANGGQIRGLANTLGLRITNASAGTEWMRINASGYVGIGTAAPTATLEVLPANESATAGIKVRR